MAALGLARLEPLEAAPPVVRLLLLGQQQRQSQPVCQRGPAGVYGEVRGILAAAMQQHDQRRGRAHLVRRQVDAQPQRSWIGTEVRQDDKTARSGSAQVGSSCLWTTCPASAPLELPPAGYWRRGAPCARRRAAATRVAIPRPRRSDPIPSDQSICKGSVADPGRYAAMQHHINRDRATVRRAQRPAALPARPTCSPAAYALTGWTTCARRLRADRPPACRAGCLRTDRLGVLTRLLTCRPAVCLPTGCLRADRPAYVPAGPPYLLTGRPNRSPECAGGRSQPPSRVSRGSCDRLARRAAARCCRRPCDSWR